MGHFFAQKKLTSSTIEQWLATSKPKPAIRERSFSLTPSLGPSLEVEERLVKVEEKLAGLLEVEERLVEVEENVSPRLHLKMRRCLMARCQMVTNDDFPLK